MNKNGYGNASVFIEYKYMALGDYIAIWDVGNGLCDYAGLRITCQGTYNTKIPACCITLLCYIIFYGKVMWLRDTIALSLLLLKFF